MRGRGRYLPLALALEVLLVVPAPAMPPIILRFDGYLLIDPPGAEADGGSGGRDFSLSILRSGAKEYDEENGDVEIELLGSSWGVMGSGMLSVEAVEGVLAI